MKSVFIDEWPNFLQLASRRIVEIANDAIEARGVFHCVLAGGETPRALYSRLAELETDWPSWRFWFGDERCLADGDPGRNSTMVDRALLDCIPVSDSQVMRIPGELGAEAAASTYAQALASAPVFDLVLLGLGEDGHIASLFPGNDLGDAESSSDVLAVLNAPKPPRQRVSMAIKRLARSRQIVFVVAGDSKLRAVKALQNREAIPASAIREHKGIELMFSAGRE